MKKRGRQGRFLALVITFFFFFFLIVATPETRARGALPPTQNHKQTKKMWKIPGDESGQGAEARASLNMRRGEVSISH